VPEDRGLPGDTWGPEGVLGTEVPAALESVVKRFISLNTTGF